MKTFVNFLFAACIISILAIGAFFINNKSDMCKKYYPKVSLYKCVTGKTSSNGKVYRIDPYNVDYNK